MGTAATLAKAKYNAKAYDVFSVRCKKGMKESIEFCAKSAGKSINSFIVDAVVRDMNNFKASQIGRAHV